MQENKKKEKTKNRSIYDFFSNATNNNTTDKEEEDPYYGMKHTTKASNVTRLWFTNPCGIGVDPLHPKSDSSFSFLRQKSKCDIFGLAETNVHWYMLYNHASLYARVKRRWKNFKISTSHNKHEKIGKTQRGGTCTVAVNQVAFREYSRGQDETGLGRWSWLEFRGKDEHVTRVYTAYRPGGKPNKKTTAHTTVYEQHIRYIRDKEEKDMDPRTYFDKSISNEIKSIIHNTNIVLMIDVNQNVVTGTFTKLMEEIGLQSIFKRLDMKDLPPTHHRGRHPISTIYISSHLCPIRAGILPKTVGVQGDHRNIYVDITNDSLLGVYMYKIIPPPMKRLQLKDPRIVKKFQKAVKKHLSHNNMLHTGLSLLEESRYPCSSAQKSRMESFDDQLGRAIANGLAKCRKLRTGEIPFSRLFKVLRDTRRLWLLVIKKKVGQNISNTTIRRLAKKLKITSPMTHSKKAAVDNFRQAEKEYRSLNRQTALTQRNQFNEELAAASAIQMNTSKGKILKRIIYDEQVREQTRMSRRYFPKRNQASKKVDRVQHKKNGTWVEESTPRNVATACQRDTEEKYRETDKTPLMEKSIHSLIGNFSETTFSNKFRNFEAELPEDVSRWTKAMMDKVRMDYTIPRLPIPMTTTEIKKVWKTVKEHKASSPSGRYNGVYKAMCVDSDLLQILTISMNLPFVMGVPYKRWHEMIDIMAFKKADNIRVDNIRSIIISEADWNAAGKVHVTRRMMAQAEKKNLLPAEHIGGRKGKKSIDAVLTKRLTLDNSRITQTPMIVISTDAANCYDRMLHKYISFVCVKWGLAVQVLIALLQPLQKATHHTRTAFGDKYAEFTGENLQGAGQGNTGAAPFWTAVSTPLIETMQEYSMQAEFKSPLTGIVVILTLLAFVDDTELFLTAQMNETPEQLMVRAEMAINLWRECLYVTGGIMRSSKCAWTLLDYEGTLQNSIMLPQRSNPGSIKMPEENGTIRIVPRYDKDDPREYLGVVQTTNGEEIEQVKNMTQKILDWNEIIKQSRLPPALNLKAVMCKIHKTLQYPLPALTLSEKCLQKLSNKLYWESLPKCGIVRTFPIQYRHLPEKYQGLGLPNLYLEQETGKIMHIINFAYTNSVEWRQLQVGLETLQVRLGTQKIIFDYNYYEFAPICPECWLKSLWLFCHEMELKVKGWKMERPLGKRDGDEYIMETITKHNISQRELMIFNECRLFLQVETLSDMSNGEGIRISECYYKGRRDPHRISNIEWPNIRRPNVTKWIIWQRWLDEIWCKEKSLHTLHHALGPWRHQPTQKWQWYFDESTKELYYLVNERIIKKCTSFRSNSRHRHQRQWFICRDIQRSNLMRREYIESLPRATVCENSSQRAKLDGWNIQGIPKSPGRNFNDLIQQLLKDKVPKWMYSQHNFSHFNSISQISRFFQKPLRAVTDASVKLNKGTACIIIETEDQTKQMIFITKIPSNLMGLCTNDSYRSELGGIWATLKMIKSLENITRSSTRLKMACDNFRAIELTEGYQYANTAQQHFDFARAIIEIRQQITSKIEYMHVRGHMDQHQPFQKLSRMEQLNVLCDKYAKEANNSLLPQEAVHLPDEGLSLWYNGQKIYSNFKESIKSIYWRNKALAVIKQKYSWTNEQFNSVDWNALEKSMGMMHTSLKIRISKFVTKTLPVGCVMDRRKEWMEPFCPRCGFDNETPSHVIQCPHQDARKTLKVALGKFETVLDRLETEKTLKFQVMVCVTEWITQGKVFPPKNILQPIQDQLELGWKHFMEGRITTSFRNYMDHHYQNAGSKKNGTNWVAIVIHSLWTHIFTFMWEHRNKYVHAIELKNKVSREHLNLNYKIREMYSKALSTTLLHQDQHLLQESVGVLVKSPTGRKRGWLFAIAIALKESEKAILAENLQMRNSMYAFRITGSCTGNNVSRKRRHEESQHGDMQQTEAKRARNYPQMRKRNPESALNITSDKDAHVKKRIKRNPNRKKASSYLDRMKPKLPTIREEEWEKEQHVRKK